MDRAPERRRFKRDAEGRNLLYRLLYKSGGEPVSFANSRSYSKRAALFRKAKIINSQVRDEVELGCGPTKDMSDDSTHY